MALGSKPIRRFAYGRPNTAHLPEIGAASIPIAHDPLNVLDEPGSTSQGPRPKFLADLCFMPAQLTSALRRLTPTRLLVTIFSGGLFLMKPNLYASFFE